MTELNIGPQIGGQSFYEVIFFNTTEALAKFKQGHFETSAQAGAEAVTQGAALDTNFRNGVTVFTLAKGALMLQATIGSQKIKYEPLD